MIFVSALVWRTECLGYHYAERFVTERVTVAASSNDNYAVLEHLVPSPLELASLSGTVTTTSPTGASLDATENSVSLVNRGSVFPVTIYHDDQSPTDAQQSSSARTVQCGVKAGCLGLPSGCVASDSCDVLVVYSLMPDTRRRRRRAVTSTGPETPSSNDEQAAAASTASTVYNTDFNRQRVLFRIVTRRPKTAGPNGGWYAAVGFNTNNQMPGADVVECIAPAAAGFGASAALPRRIIESRAEAYKLPVRYTSNLLGNVDVSVAANGDADVVECTFSYPLGKPVGMVAANDGEANSTSVRKLGDNVFMLVATGPLTPNGAEIGYHASNKLVSDEPVDLKFISVLNSSRSEASLLVKLHAGLMVGAWMFLASLGVFFARYFKTWYSDAEPCGTKLWFFVSIMYKFACIMKISFGGEI